MGADIALFPEMWNIGYALTPDQEETKRNAIGLDSDYITRFREFLVALAKANGCIVGMAGVSNDCAKMWQVGMDVLPEYRNRGLAAYLVNRLTLEILNRGYIPYYGTSHSNIA